MGLIDKIGEVLHLGESEDFELQNIKQEWKIEESVPLVIVRWGANPPPPNKEILMYSVFGIDKESGKHKWGFMDNPIGMLLDNENGYVSSQSSRNYKARSIRGVTSGIVLAEGNISFDIFSKINSCISGNLVELEGEIMQIRSIIFRNRIRNRFNPLLLPKFMWDNLRKNMAAEVFNTTVVPSSSYYNPFKFITNAIHKFIILTDVGDYYAIDFKGSLNHGLTQRTRVKVSGSLNKANRTVLAKSIIVSDVELSEKVSLPISEKGFKNVSAISGSVISSEIRPINCENYRDWLFSQVRVYNGNEWIGAIEELYRNYRDQFSTEEFMLPTYFLKLHSENDKTEHLIYRPSWYLMNRSTSEIECLPILSISPNDKVIADVMTTDAGVYIVKRIQNLSNSCYGFSITDPEDVSHNSELDKTDKITGMIVSRPIELVFGFDPTAIKNSTILFDESVLPTIIVFKLDTFLNGKQTLISCCANKNIFTKIFSDYINYYLSGEPIPFMINKSYTLNGKFHFTGVFKILKIVEA